MYLLDTNVCIQFLNGTSVKIKSRLQNTSPHNISLCSIVVAELLFGARNSQRVQENLLRLEQFFVPFIHLPFDNRCAEEYAQIRVDLGRQGNLIGPNDMLIAATARAHDLILISNNVSEFSRIANLRIRDWQSPASA